MVEQSDSSTRDLRAVFINRRVSNAGEVLYSDKDLLKLLRRQDSFNEILSSQSFGANGTTDIVSGNNFFVFLFFVFIYTLL